MKNNSNRGLISGILGTLIVIAGVIAYAVVSSLINRVFIGLRFGDDVACASLTLSGIGLTVAFVLYEVIFFTWQFRATKKSSGKDTDAEKMSKILKIVAASCISLSLIFAIFSANTFVELREDSISKVCFTTTKAYRWDDRNDVLRYTFSCDAEGGLTFKITMKDGKVIDILGGTISHSKAFGEKYDTTNLRLLDYAAHLSDEFDSSDFIIEKKINGTEYMEKFYKESFPEAWREIEKIIE